LSFLWVLAATAIEHRYRTYPAAQAARFGAFTKEAAMSILSKFTHCALAAFLTFGVLSPTSQVVAQTSPTKTASVLPTGGGAALLDTSDTVILLLDHQTGLFQTVKDISVAELRSNTIMLAKLQHS
jgi:hypothetical protein